MSAAPGLKVTSITPSTTKFSSPSALNKNKTPSAELKEGHTDEGEIGMTYAQMDEILMKFEAGGQPESELEQKLYSRIQLNTHKNSVPPVI